MPTDLKKFQSSKSAKPVGITPAVALCNPKYAHNVGAAMRAASCYGVSQLWYTGDRVSMESKKGSRLPREERMKGYQDVELRPAAYEAAELTRLLYPAKRLRLSTKYSKMLMDLTS